MELLDDGFINFLFLHHKPSQNLVASSNCPFICSQFCALGNSSREDFPGGPVVKTVLPAQGVRVQSLVWEDPTCHGTAKPMCHNYWAQPLEPMFHNKRSCRNEEPAQRRVTPAHRNQRKPMSSSEDLMKPKINEWIKKKEKDSTLSMQGHGFDPWLGN